MKHEMTSTLSCHSWADLLKNYALMTALPKGFLLKSSTQRTMMVNPAATAEKLVPLIDKSWKIIMASDSIILYTGKNSVMSVMFMTGRVDIQVYCSDLGAEVLAEKVIKPFEKFKFENKDDGGVWVNFCFSNGMNVERNTQFLRCPTWAELQENYPWTCRNELGRTIQMNKPWADGRLMIWHGQPGTGKTFAIRSLLMAWRERFNFVIVTDPEKMLANPAYYYEISSAPNMNSVPGAQPQDDEDDESSDSKKKRLLFIIEDSGDLSSAESRKKHWDKFGKLLNITDGLIGQGREDIFLLTFNEELKAIDPAMVRPGRCISQLEFKKFSTEEAQKWLSKNGLGHLEPSGSDTFEDASLAELYQMKAKAHAKKNVPVTV